MIRTLLALFAMSTMTVCAGEDVVFTDIDGKKHAPFSDEKVKAVVLVFITTISILSVPLTW